MSRGIADAVVYLPAFRISAEEVESAWGVSKTRGIETKTVASADEDAVTMAIAAGDQLLSESRIDREDIGHVSIATTTPPMEEERQIPRIVRALGLLETVHTTSHTQSTAAGGDAIATALDATEPALVLVSDVPEGQPGGTDHAFGAGSVAFLIDDPADVVVLESASYMVDSPGIRYRRRGEEDVERLDISTYERDSLANCVAGAVDQLTLERDRLAAAALPQPDGSTPARLGNVLGVQHDIYEPGTVVGRTGDVGVATVAIGLAAALEHAGEGDPTLSVFSGSGTTVRAFVFEGHLDSGVSNTIDGGQEITYSRYLRQRGYVVDGDVAGGGANVSLPTWQRSLDQRYRLVAGQCSDCGALAFPPEGACPECRTRNEYVSVEMPRIGTIRAVTTVGQGGAPPEFNEFQERAGDFANAIVEHSIPEGSVKIPGQVTDVSPDSVSIGDEVEAVVRRLYVQEGISRYGCKYIPAR